MSVLEICTKMLNRDEGWSSKPYYCSEGYPTIGIGRKVGKKGDPLPNITTSKIAEDSFLKTELSSLINKLSTSLFTQKIYPKLSGIRQSVLVCMCYQMGFERVLQFHKMWAALSEKDYDKAAAEMLDSVWHKQTKLRCERMAHMMNTNELDKYYA